MSAEKKATLLVVDDEVKILRTITRLLLDEDVSLLIADNAESGFELLQKHKVNIVISDWRMPYFSGARFLKEVNQKYPDTHCFLMTAYNDEIPFAKPIDQDGSFEVLSKPFEEHELKHILAQACSTEDERTVHLVER